MEPLRGREQPSHPQQRPTMARSPRTPLEGESIIPAGSVAPPFSLPDSPYTTVALHDFRGIPVVLAFYVADWHPVAIEQLRQLERARRCLGEGRAAVLGISVDATWSHGAFARELEIQFPLLADREPPGAVSRAYGVETSDGRGGRRALVVIDGGGIVRWSAVFPDALNPGIDGILTALESITSPTGASPSG